MTTPTFQKKVFGRDGGEAGIDEDFAARGFHNIGAWILGRNMFGPVRGPWSDESWKGWWGDTPPFHTPVFVLTHHERPSITLADTTFHFVDGEPGEWSPRPGAWSDAPLRRGRLRWRSGTRSDMA